MNNTQGYEGIPGEDDTWVSQEHLLLGVGVGTGLLFSLALLAIIATLACRGQHIRRGKRSGRLTSTVSMAYSDFETYKVARPHSISTPSTNISTISSSDVSRIYASPFKTGTIDKPVHKAPGSYDISSSSSQSSGMHVGRPDSNATLVLGGWRTNTDPIIGQPSASHSEPRRKQQHTTPSARGRRLSDVTVGGVQYSDDPATFNFDTRMLSPAYQGRTKREDHTRPFSSLSTA